MALTVLASDEVLHLLVSCQEGDYRVNLAGVRGKHH